MNWFYVRNDQQAGPVSEEQLAELERSGTINPQTLVWREGLPDWQALATALPTAAPPPPATGPGVTCAECGHAFPAGDVIMLNRSWICAACKPVFLQRLREGASLAGAAGGLWRSQNRLVARTETPFPDRCVRCNAPAGGYRLKRQLFWHPWGYYLFILLNLLIYLVVALCVRKRATVQIGLCAKHRVRRYWGIVGCTIGVLGGFALIFGGIFSSSGGLAVLGTCLLLGGAVYGAVTGARISAGRISGEHVWLKGVNKDFLADLPEWNG